MSCDSRSVPQEQLTPDDLHPPAPPMPVINLGHLTLEPETSRVVDDIAKACHDLGYFHVINHGISQSVMDGAVEAASDFFKLPSETKQEFASDDIRRPVRYGTSSNDGTHMSRAFLKHYAHPLGEWMQYWPEKPPTYREDMGKFSAEVRRVALQLMEAILEGLGLGKHYQHEEFERGLQLLQVNCYSEEPEGESAIGFAPHSDHGFLTILLTSCPGLEVVDRSSDTWRVVQQPRHALHVHVGDYMEVLSNGRIKTVVHRAVLNPAEARISMASIHSFAMHEKVSVAKELVDEQDHGKYKESSFSDFLEYLTSKMHEKVSVAKELVDEQDHGKYKESSFSDFLEYLTSNTEKKRASFLEGLRM